MGCCVSKPDGEKAKESRNDEIDRALRMEQKKMRNDVKLLLLGTFVRQTERSGLRGAGCADTHTRACTRSLP